MQPVTVRPRRPTGVTVLAVLAIIVGILGLLAGGALLALWSAISSGAVNSSNAMLPSNISSAVLQSIALVFGAVLLVLGIIYIAVGVGFLGGRGWSWTLGIAISVISIIFNIAGAVFNPLGSVAGSAVSIIISVIIIYYLTRPHVKAFFGKGPMVVGTMGPPVTGPPPSTAPPPP